MPGQVHAYSQVSRTMGQMHANCEVSCTMVIATSMAMVNLPPKKEPNFLQKTGPA